MLATRREVGKDSDVRSVPNRGRLAIGLFLELRLVPVVQWSFTGVILGTALAGRSVAISVPLLIASIVVAMLIHGVIAHCANDLVDARSGTDAHPAPRILSGGSKVLGLGLLETRHLRMMGAVGATAAAVVGAAVASQRGWWLLGLGLVGMLGAATYSLPPVRGAYRPFVGEAIAVACGWICVFGTDAAQRGAPSGLAALVALHWVLACMTMLMLHHIPDREPDLAASPQKRTTVALIATRPHWYAAAWPIAGAAIGAWVAITDLPELWPSVAGAVLAAIAAVAARPDDLASVTRSEMISVVVVMVGGLASAALMVGGLAWAALIPLVLLPLDAMAGKHAARIGRQGPPGDSGPGTSAAVQGARSLGSRARAKRGECS